jgi:hypothetical protein
LPAIRDQAPASGAGLHKGHGLHLLEIISIIKPEGLDLPAAPTSEKVRAALLFENKKEPSPLCSVLHNTIIPICSVSFNVMFAYLNIYAQGRSDPSDPGGTHFL